MVDLCDYISLQCGEGGEGGKGVLLSYCTLRRDSRAQGSLVLGCLMIASCENAR